MRAHPPHTAVVLRVMPPPPPPPCRGCLLLLMVCHSDGPAEADLPAAPRPSYLCWMSGGQCSAASDGAQAVTPPLPHPGGGRGGGPPRPCVYSAAAGGRDGAQPTAAGRAGWRRSPSRRDRVPIEEAPFLSPTLSALSPAGYDGEGGMQRGKRGAVKLDPRENSATSAQLDLRDRLAGVALNTKTASRQRVEDDKGSPPSKPPAGRRDLPYPQQFTLSVSFSLALSGIHHHWPLGEACQNVTWAWQPQPPVLLRQSERLPARHSRLPRVLDWRLPRFEHYYRCASPLGALCRCKGSEGGSQGCLLWCIC